jgi:hypothetical protein
MFLQGFEIVGERAEYAPRYFTPFVFYGREAVF